MELQRILYVSHRYHTNQVPIMKGWKDHGVEVLFLVQYEGVSEVHDYVRFKCMKPSVYTRCYNWFADSYYDASKAESKKNVAFIPSFWNVLKTIKAFMPQIVILRNMSKGNAVICIICKLLRIKYVINYTQTPLYREKSAKKPFSFLAKCIYPNVSFTPVWYKGEYRGNNMPKEWYSPHYFIPLVCEPNEKPKREYCKNGIIHLLDVGKYRDYKNHFFLIDAFAEVSNKDCFSLTIIGQVENNTEIDYYHSLVNYIKEKGLDKYVTVKGNVPFKEMSKVYLGADVLILPSKSETAGVVILEAMAQGLCVMSGNNCGLASYLEKSECGMVFTIKDSHQLADQLNELSENKDIIRTLGVSSIEAVKKYYGFTQYFKSLNLLMEDYYKESIDLYKEKGI